MNIFNGKDNHADFIAKFEKEFGANGELCIVEKLRLFLTRYPEYEFWEFPRYYWSKRKSGPLIQQWGDWLISTKGNICKISVSNGVSESVTRANGLITIDRSKSIAISEDYHKAEHDGVTYLLHRLIASTFIPRPLELRKVEFKDLQVNHIDGDKTNPSMTNLEWTTPAGNIRHAVETNLKSVGYYKGTLVYDHGRFKSGFTIYGRLRELADRGFPYEIPTSASVKGVRFKFRWERINQEVGQPNLIVPDDLDVSELGFGRTAVVTLDTDIPGFNRGQRFKVKISHMAKNGFKENSITRACTKLRSRAYLCTFDYYTVEDIDVPYMTDEFMVALKKFCDGIKGRVPDHFFNP
ncbi:putative HNH endonuclease [Serratia phage vB_SmaS-Totoro]|nr:putative HNH endonuclease [Serratia phage vB_SmaS-Totoro]